MKATGSETDVCFMVRCSCISQENQVDYDGGGGTIIFIAWIKFFSFEEKKLFFSLIVLISSG